MLECVQLMGTEMGMDLEHRFYGVNLRELGVLTLEKRSLGRGPYGSLQCLERRL